MMQENPKKGIFRVLELIPEIIGWIQIFISPFLIGVIIGSIIILVNQGLTGILIGISIAALGCIIGIRWATQQWKSKGTVHFISRVIATPELDRPDAETQSDQITFKEENSDNKQL